MARMPDSIEADARAAVGWAERAMGDLFHRHHQTSAAPAAAAPIPASQENHMSFGSDMHRIATIVETFGEDGLAKLEAIDKALAAKMEAIQANPGAMQLVDFALNFLHLPPSAFSVAMAALAETSKLFDPQQGVQQQPAQPAMASADSDPRTR
jgi:hypothetical protein